MMLPQNFSQVTEGLAAIQSEFGPKETMDRLEAELVAQGMRVFARINHAALAAGIDRIRLGNAG